MEIFKIHKTQWYATRKPMGLLIEMLNTCPETSAENLAMLYFKM